VVGYGGQSLSAQLMTSLLATRAARWAMRCGSETQEGGNNRSLFLIVPLPMRRRETDNERHTEGGQYAFRWAVRFPFHFNVMGSLSPVISSAASIIAVPAMLALERATMIPSCIGKAGTPRSTSFSSVAIRI
jgi:hypothetical protein